MDTKLLYARGVFVTPLRCAFIPEGVHGYQIILC